MVSSILLDSFKMCIKVSGETPGNFDSEVMHAVSMLQVVVIDLLLQRNECRFPGPTTRTQNVTGFQPSM